MIRTISGTITFLLGLALLAFIADNPYFFYEYPPKVRYVATVLALSLIGYPLVCQILENRWVRRPSKTTG